MEAQNDSVMAGLAGPQDEMGDAYSQQFEIPQEQAQESDQEINFRRLREAHEREKRELEQERREREQDRQMILALQKQLLEAKVAPPQKEPEQDPFADVAPDDWTTYSQVTELSKRAASESVRSQIEEFKREMEEAKAQEEFAKTYSDFPSVVTTENVNKLRAVKPQLARALSMIGSETHQAVAAYEAIKSYVLTEEQKSEEQKRIEQNSYTPKSVNAAAGSSPLAKVSQFDEGLTPELQKAYYQEMIACASRI